METINPAPLIGKISELGALASFMLLVVLYQAWQVRDLVKKTDDQQKVILDALLNNTKVVAEFSRTMEIHNSKL